MAGEVHPVPFRTRKLSPLAPMVLRSSPWESRTSLTNEGHLRAGRAPSPMWWRGPLAFRGAQAKPTVTYESMSSHAASNAVVTVPLSLMRFFRFLDVCLRYWHNSLRSNALKDFKRPAGMPEGSGCRHK